MDSLGVNIPNNTNPIPITKNTTNILYYLLNSINDFKFLFKFFNIQLIYKETKKK